MADPVEVPEGLRLDRKAFRAWADERAGRWERVDSRPVGMAPERLIHARLKFRVCSALDRAIKAAGVPCEAITDGFPVEVDENTDYEPDALVQCGGGLSLDDLGTPNPTIVVEVASPSNSRVSLDRKFVDYFQMRSVQHLLMIEGRRRMVAHSRKAGEQIETRLIAAGPIVCDPPGLTITVEEIYEGSDL